MRERRQTGGRRWIEWRETGEKQTERGDRPRGGGGRKKQSNRERERESRGGGGGGGGQRQIEIETERDRKSERDTHTQRQTETDRQRQRQREKDRDRETERNRDREGDRDRERARETERARAHGGVAGKQRVSGAGAWSDDLMTQDWICHFPLAASSLSQPGVCGLSVLPTPRTFITYLPPAYVSPRNVHHPNPPPPPVSPPCVVPFACNRPRLWPFLALLIAPIIWVL